MGPAARLELHVARRKTLLLLTETPQVYLRKKPLSVEELQTALCIAGCKETAGSAGVGALGMWARRGEEIEGVGVG